jgi:RimJ/RimL family protein N-acetyltransferase
VTRQDGSGPEPINRLPEVVEAGVVNVRRFTASDAPALVSAVTASLPELARWFEWAQTPPDVDRERERLARADRAFGAGTDYEFAVVEPDSGELVGGLRLNPSAGPQTAGIGYWIRSDRHRRGYASAGSRAVATATFASLPTVERIEIHMDQANRASAAVARRVGFELAREVEREMLAPGHTGRGFVWVTTRSRWTDDP